MRRIIQVKSKITGKVYEMETNCYEYGMLDVLELHGILEPPKRQCDMERGYSLREPGVDLRRFLDPEDFEVIKDECDYSEENRIAGAIEWPS